MEELKVGDRVILLKGWKNISPGSRATVTGVLVTGVYVKPDGSATAYHDLREYVSDTSIHLG